MVLTTLSQPSGAEAKPLAKGGHRYHTHSQNGKVGVEGLHKKICLEQIK